MILCVSCGLGHLLDNHTRRCAIRITHSEIDYVVLGCAEPGLHLVDDGKDVGRKFLNAIVLFGFRGHKLSIMTRVTVIGAGPAGTAAAISALRHGASVHLYEKSRFPRHKVCGEFLSPETGHLLDQLGVDWRAAKPAPLKRLMLCFEGKRSISQLPEGAYGLSRHAMDAMLLCKALQNGAQLYREQGERSSGPTVIASGRKSHAAKGDRLFGFKAHFEGPANDSMELYFQKDGAYVGVNAVECGVTNVCGIAPEATLAAYDFEIDRYVETIPILSARLANMTRKWNWLRVGPLVFENQLKNGTTFPEYYAGDSLSFVDPFTGSGMLTALLTGILAGEFAASGKSVADYIDTCGNAIRNPIIAARLIRLSIRFGVAPWMQMLVPHRLLFRLTRPRVIPPRMYS